MDYSRRKRKVFIAASLTFALLCGAAIPTRSASAETLEIGIGIQNTTTNTVTGGAILKEMGLLEKHLPKTGKYKDITYSLSWQNFTSGPPVTNGMMANNIQIGMMGDYPLLINGATGQQTGNETELVAVLAYNAQGGGNAILVNKDTPLYDFDDLKGKTVSVPFGSAAHGMLLAALQQRGLPNDFWNLVSQTPEIGSTNLQAKRIDAHADFVPFPELLPFRGFARKVYDGVETKIPTFHAVVVRKDFAQKYPEIVVAYIEAVMEANDWVRKNPQLAAEKIESWTKINKEVAYIYLGPDGIMTLDPTIKPQWVAAMKTDYAVLQKLNLIKKLDIGAWVNDTYVRQAFKDEGLDYDGQLKKLTGYHVTGDDPVCNVHVTNPAEAGQIWVQGGNIVNFSSPACTLAGVAKFKANGHKLNAVYLMDHEFGIKVFADEAFYAVKDTDQHKPQVTPFLLKRDAAAYAKNTGGKLATYEQALSEFQPASK